MSASLVAAATRRAKDCTTRGSETVPGRAGAYGETSGGAAAARGTLLNTAPPARAAPTCAINLRRLVLRLSARLGTAAVDSSFGILSSFIKRDLRSLLLSRQSNLVQAVCSLPL